MTPDEAEGRLPRAGAPLYKRCAIAGVLIFFLTSGAVATGTLLKVDTIAKKLRSPEGPATFEPRVITKAEAGDPQTILLVGSDKRFGATKEDARSDTMMLVRLDPDQEATAVMSIPRDLVTQIPGHGTRKINSAYSFGGLNLATKTVKELLGGATQAGTAGTAAAAAPVEPFEINHAIGVNFKGFRQVVNFLGCVYTDIDRRYYHSNVGVPPALQYAEIDVQPGYQKLCGQRALDYVRFRHDDSDLVRAARQQDFLRQAKDQVGTSSLLNDLDPLAEIFGNSTESDGNLTTLPGILRVLKLAAYSTGHPVREIQFPATFAEDDGQNGLGSYITATPDQIAKAVDQFMHATPAAEPHKTGPEKGTSAAAKRQARRSAAKGSSAYAKYGLVVNRKAGEDLVAGAVATGKVSFPLYYAKAITRRGRYPADTKIAPMPRAYTLRDRADKPHQAYRIVVVENELEGQYYGVQGTTWQNPPILASTPEPLRMRGRTYELRYDGKRLRTVAWRTPRGVYWISNTLSLSLSNQKMKGLARSLTRLGA